MNERTLRRGDKVKAKVIRHTPGGVIVEVRGAGKGVIRNRELSWTRSHHSSRERLSENARLELMVLDIKEDGFLELSLKRAQRDPWERVRRGEYSEGDTVTGEIVNLERFGAFVELEPGIEGLLPKGEIPTAAFQEIQDLLWVGDHVEVCIQEIRVSGRKMRLSIEGRLKKRQRKQMDGAGEVGLPRRFIPQDAQEHVEGQTALPQLRDVLAQKIQKILIVDDDVEFANGFAEWLGRLGYRVTVVETEREVRSLFIDYDLVFVDIDLGDDSGLQLAAYIAQGNPDVEIVLMTGLSWARLEREIPADLHLSAFLLKPLNYAEIVDLLKSFEEGTVQPISLPESALKERDSEFLSQITQPPQEFQDLEASLEKILSALRKEARARAAVIFGVDPFTHRVSKLAACGSEVADIDMEALQSLRFSPVKDVALEGKSIVEAWDEEPFHDKFNRLFELLFYFNACVAFPVPSDGLDTRYALFLLDPMELDFRSKQPLHEHQTRVFSAAQLAAAMIREERLRSLVGKTQSLFLTGQLASSLLHEIRNNINRVEQHAQIMDLDCQDYGANPEERTASSWHTCFSQRVEHILEANAELGELVKEYLGLMGKDRLETTNINKVLARTVRQIGPSAREGNVTVRTQLATDLPAMKTVPLRLEQVFLNVALNAVQQMHLPYVDGNQLLITTTYDAQDEARPLKIRFEDQGPGIHGKLWDWVFEMGTSTREGGAGLGLFGSCRLLESVGGRISVESSYMFVSSTFLIELPLEPISEVTDA